MHDKTKVLFQGTDIPMGGESLWAEPVAKNRFRLLNAPFYALGFAEGDVVRCTRSPKTNQLIVEGLEVDSGNGTLRLLFADAQSTDAQEVLNELSSVGCTHERASTQLVASTVPSTLEVQFSQLSNYLNALPDSVLQGWEIGKRFTPAGRLSSSV